MCRSHRFHPTILREYDVRGIVGETLDAADAEALERAFGKVVRGRGGVRVALGYNSRLSSPKVAMAAGPSLERLKALVTQQLQQSGLKPTAEFAPAGRESASV